MMLITSIASILITGYIGYSSGRENLSQTVFDPPMALPPLPWARVMQASRTGRG